MPPPTPPAAPHPLSQLKRVHGRVRAPLQDGPGVPEGADGDRPAHPEKVGLTHLPKKRKREKKKTDDGKSMLSAAVCLITAL